jgi:hypothetical protein
MPALMTVSPKLDENYGKHTHGYKGAHGGGAPPRNFLGSPRKKHLLRKNLKKFKKNLKNLKNLKI